MSAKGLSAILICANLVFLIQGLNSTDLVKRDTTYSNRRIYNGQAAELSDYPYLVHLDINGGTGAGSIIREYWILTAAHVPYNQSCRIILISPVAWNPGEKVQPIECYSHEQYHPGSYAYDVGLLKTSQNLLQDGRAQAIPLPQPGTTYAIGTPATIVGWGATEKDQLAERLMHAQLKVKDWNFCNRDYQTNLCKGEPRCIPGDMPVRVVCTHNDRYPVPNTCYGDSGGPVVINDAVAGIVSFGIPVGDFMCRPGSPSMHTAVVDYLPWIYAIISPGMDTSNMPVRPENSWRK